jgi:hypothetical protein
MVPQGFSANSAAANLAEITDRFAYFFFGGRNFFSIDATTT